MKIRQARKINKRSRFIELNWKFSTLEKSLIVLGAKIPFIGHYLRIEME